MPRLCPALLAATLVGLGAARAQAADDVVGIWTLSMPGTPRQCRLQLRADPAATGQAIAMPPGCRRAFPILGAVRSWSIPDGVHVGLNNANGANVLMFDQGGDGQMRAAGPEGDGAYLLTPAGPRRTAVAATPPATPDPAPAAATVTPRAPATLAATAGHYAVMRGSRDTGCMVTLEDGGRSQAEMRARLAPACRDQGIIIFDPVGWSLKGGHLVLAARRGHTATFSADEAGTWVKDAGASQPLGTGQALGLKRL